MINEETINIIRHIYTIHQMEDPIAFETKMMKQWADQPVEHFPSARHKAECIYMKRCTGKTTFKLILAIALAQQKLKVHYKVDDSNTGYHLENRLRTLTDSWPVINRIYISSDNAIGVDFDIYIEDLNE